jgi:hypothetical protein
MIWERQRQPHIPNGYGLRFTKVSKDATQGIRRLIEHKGTKILDRAGARNRMEPTAHKNPPKPARVGERNHIEQADLSLEMILLSHGWHKVEITANSW